MRKISSVYAEEFFLFFSKKLLTNEKICVILLINQKLITKYYYQWSDEMYSIENFERPSVAADCVVFGIDSTEPDSPRSLKQRKLKILLVKRGEEPFLNHYSLAGGFLRKGETIEETAIRELKEEAGVYDPKIINIGVYSKAERDPRGWIISCAFLALTRTVTLSTAEESDAFEAYW